MSLTIGKSGDHSRAEPLPPSAAPYNGAALRLYDLFVLHFTSPHAWGCNRQYIADLYEQHSTSTHAEVGVGSGYFLRRLEKNWDTLALIDPNPATLSYAAHRIGGAGVVERHEANILNKAELPQKRFKSVAANYLLHCLPGPMAAKESAVRNLAQLTSVDGTLFGATVIGSSVRHNRLGRIVLWACNKTGAFGNIDDTEDQLRSLLERYFDVVAIRRQNTVAIFVASSPRDAALAGGVE